MESQTAVPTSLVDELVGDSIAAVSLVDGLVQDATRALFATYGVKFDLDGTQVAKILKSVEFLGMIGFSSHSLSGSLLLALPLNVLERSLPTPGGSPADWCGELANQLLGRLKNQLLKYEVVINPSLPVVVSGEGMCLPASTRQITRYFSFSSECGKIFVRLEMAISSALELERQDDRHREGSIDEGELLLF